MNAKTQYKLSAADLDLILAVSRTGKLADAGERLSMDSSTVFRSLRRVERGLGVVLFDRSRTGYMPTELAQSLTEPAEHIEMQLEVARAKAQLQPEQVSGAVLITTTDTILHGLVAPALKPLHLLHPLLSYELHTGNELASLSRRDADIAVRATKRPPPHLIGKRIGPIRMAIYAAKNGKTNCADVESGMVNWIAPDDALPEHPSVVWRKRYYPKIVPTYRVNSILTVMEFVAQDLGVGLLPMFLADTHSGLVQLTEEIEECRTELWLLTHAESRHVRRVSTVYGYLAHRLALE